MTLDLGDGFAQVNSTTRGADVQARRVQVHRRQHQRRRRLVERGQARAPYTEGAPSVDDPLASLPAPSLRPDQNLGKISGVQDVHPGHDNLGLNMKTATTSC